MPKRLSCIIADQKDAVKEMTNMEERYYDNPSAPRAVVPSSPLETDVIRQVILPDKWDVVSDSPTVPHLSVMKLLLLKGLNSYSIPSGRRS